MLSWLQQEGPRAKKHCGKAHPLVAFSLHYTVVSITTLAAHDTLLDLYWSGSNFPQCTPPPHRRNVACFFGVYFVVYFAWRLALHWKGDFFIEFYKQTFLCSVTVFNAALGLYMNRPVMAMAFCVAVGIDQFLWYIDLAGFLILGKFPIGVSKYLFWPGTSWASRITSTHHLWTIPLVTWASGGVHWLSLPLSAFVVLINVAMSRFLTPHSIVLDDDKKEVRYLNLNLAYELWTDIKMKFLLVFEGQVPYLIRLCIGWWTFNSIIFLMLYTVSERTVGPASLC